MQYADLIWVVQDPENGGPVHYVSQRLTDKSGRRVYVYKWEDNEYSICWYGPYKADINHVSEETHKELDVLDVNVRLLTMWVDTHPLPENEKLSLIEPRQQKNQYTDVVDVWLR